MLTPAQVKKFQEIYFKRFGKEISYEEASEQGAQLINALRIIFRPMTNKEYSQLLKK